MILIFGGTTEGRTAIDVCEQAGKPFYYSTKSDTQQVEMKNGIRLTGPMTEDDIIRFCMKNVVKCIIDAAHPFAENLHKAILGCQIPIIRFERTKEERIEGAIYCKGYEDAVKALKHNDIKLLLALSGANTIAKLKNYWQDHRTIFRILRRKESVEIAERNGFPSDDLIFYDDTHLLPTTAQEADLMKAVGCDAVITKESGKSGGFPAKAAAAKQLGLKLFVIEPPRYMSDNKTVQHVTGRYGLRRAIEQLLPDFFPLKTGFSTGACATAATKAALISLLSDDWPEEIDFQLPDGEIMTICVDVEKAGVASVVKDFSDDPDVTRGCRIRAEVGFNDTGDIRFLQGDGVGTVTLPGLGIPVGGPAINATPRQMMTSEIKSLTTRGCDVRISVENGMEIALNTFNSKVGVVDGISIIGTSGIVTPLSNEAFIESIGRELEVAKAIGCDTIGLASGKKGEEALKEVDSEMRVIHYGNFIGESLKKAFHLGFKSVHIGIMIGKAVKLAEGHLDTHSHKVQMNKEFLKRLAGEDAWKIDNITMARELWQIMPPDFFEKIRRLCYDNCRKAFPQGELFIHIIPAT